MASPALPPADRSRLVRELVGVLLLAAGVIGLLYCAARVDPLLAVAAGSALAVALGWRLSVSEARE